jgi:hypothetical protein
MTNRKGKKENSKRNEREIERDNCSGHHHNMFFHIWGEKGGLAHVASKGLSNLKYLVTIQKIIDFKTLKAS